MGKKEILLDFIIKRRCFVVVVVAAVFSHLLGHNLKKSARLNFSKDPTFNDDRKLMGVLRMMYGSLVYDHEMLTFLIIKSNDYEKRESLLEIKKTLECECE